VEFFHTLFQYFKHGLYEIDDHSLHSPYLYDLYSGVIRASKSIPSDPDIEELRKHYKKDHRKIQGKVLGAGSRIRGRKPPRLSEIACSGITKIKYSKLLLSLINYYQCETVIELGTSLGLNTLYLSKGRFVKHLLTFEGNPVLSEIAMDHFNSLSQIKIKLVMGDIDDTLDHQLKQGGPVDFVYLDANHTAEATLGFLDSLLPYLSQRSILVFDDIYWSSDMTDTWKRICKYPHKKLCLDLFQAGILIHDDKAPEGYFRLAF
jgi:predicted O-methyltransferase YrrM